MNIKKHIEINNWKFWFKLLSGIAVMGIMLALYIGELVEIANLKKDVKLFINEWGGGTLEQLKEQLNLQFKSQMMNWISIVPNVLVDKANVTVDDLRISAGYGEYTVSYFSFFTTISNIAVGLWFLIAAFKPKKEGVKGFIGYESTLIVATTITVTMLIWTTLLMPGNVIGEKEITAWHWTSGIFQHVVFPLLLIFYVCLVWKPKQMINNREYMKKGWWKIIVIILVYGIYILIRGEMRYQGDRPHDTQYPYFFLRIHDPKLSGMPGPGWIWFFVVLILIIGICLGFSIAYNSILLKINKPTNKKVVKKTK